jgi:antitoxin component of MazEF toxin-antitoxin module
MKKKFVRHGNSIALVIDKPIFELLNFKFKDGVRMYTDGKRLTIEAPKLKDDMAHLDRWLKKADTRRVEMYRQLSKP